MLLLYICTRKKGLSGITDHDNINNMVVLPLNLLTISIGCYVMQDVLDSVVQRDNFYLHLYDFDLI